MKKYIIIYYFKKKRNHYIEMISLLHFNMKLHMYSLQPCQVIFFYQFDPIANKLVISIFEYLQIVCIDIRKIVVTMSNFSKVSRAV